MGLMKWTTTTTTTNKMPLKAMHGGAGGRTGLQWVGTDKGQGQHLLKYWRKAKSLIKGDMVSLEIFRKQKKKKKVQKMAAFLLFLLFIWQGIETLTWKDSIRESIHPPSLDEQVLSECPLRWEPISPWAHWILPITCSFTFVLQRSYIVSFKVAQWTVLES